MVLMCSSFAEMRMRSGKRKRQTIATFGGSLRLQEDSLGWLAQQTETSSPRCQLSYFCTLVKPRPGTTVIADTKQAGQPVLCSLEVLEASENRCDPLGACLYEDACLLKQQWGSFSALVCRIISSLWSFCCSTLQIIDFLNS